MNHNPISDTVPFLLQPAWTTAIFSLLPAGHRRGRDPCLSHHADAAHYRACRQLVFSVADRLHVVAADPVEIAPVLYRPSGAAVRRDGSGLLDDRDGPVRGNPLPGPFLQQHSIAAFLSVRTH